MQSRPLRFAVFLRAEPLHPTMLQERLTIYAAKHAARHFLARCIKPVTGLIVSRACCCFGRIRLALGNRAEGACRPAQCGRELQRSSKTARRRLYTTRIRL